MRNEVTFFNDTSTAYRAEYAEETPDGYSFRVRRDKVLALLGAGNDRHMLDLASGPGIMIAGARAQHWSITCIDAAPAMIEIAKREAGNDPRVTCEVGDAYQLRFADGTFDALSAMGLIEYLDEEDTFLAEAARVLKPGGLCIITFPNVTSPWRLWNRVLMLLRFIVRPIKKLLGSPLHPVTHREYSIERACEIMSAHELEPVTVGYYNFRLIPYPIDRLFPRLTVRQSAMTERLDRTPLRFIGTGFIVAAHKSAPQR